MTYKNLLNQSTPIDVTKFPDFKNTGQKLNNEAIKQIIGETQFLAVIWIFKWDEWKGLEALNFALNEAFELIVAPVWWPNAWHTVELPGWKKFVWHNLPWAALTGKTIFMWQWKYINTKWMLDELKNLHTLWSEPNLKIAYNSHCIFDSFHWKMDWSIEDMKSKNWNQVWSTKAGMWPVVATRALRSNITMWDLVNKYKTKSDLKVHVLEMIEPYNKEMFWEVDEIVAEIQEHQKLLQDLIDNKTVEIVDDNYASDIYIKWVQALVEWSQSDPLWMFGWAYPNNTSTDTRSSWILSSLNIMPEAWRYWEVIVWKLLSTAVWKHIFKERISHMFPNMLKEEEELARNIWEYWATTERLRMLGFATPLAFAEYIKRNPYVIAMSVRKCDILAEFDNEIWHKFWNKLPIITGKDKEWNLDVTLTNYEPQEIITTFRKTISEIAWKWRWNLPIITWVGPLSWEEDSRINI